MTPTVPLYETRSPFVDDVGPETKVPVRSGNVIVLLEVTALASVNVVLVVAADDAKLIFFVLSVKSAKLLIKPINDLFCTFWAALSKTKVSDTPPKSGIFTVLLLVTLLAMVQVFPVLLFAAEK